MISMHIIALAEKEAIKSDMKHKLSAVIYDKRDRIIAVGHNRMLIRSSNARQIFYKGKYRYSIHAEIDAIQQCGIDETWGNNIYIHRSGGKMAMPCEECFVVIKQFGFKHIFWSG